MLVVCDKCHSSRQRRRLHQQGRQSGPLTERQRRGSNSQDKHNGDPCEVEGEERVPPEEPPSLSCLLCELCVDRRPHDGPKSRRTHHPSTMATSSPSYRAADCGRHGHTTCNGGEPAREGGDVRVVRFPSGGCACIGSNPTPEIGRRLRILCLHGFRQTGSKLMVRPLSC